MQTKILLWSGQDFIHYCLANSLKKSNEFELYAIVDDADIGIKNFYESQKIVDFEKIWFYYDYTKPTNEPDINYLKKFESNYKINLWDIAYSDRFFYREFNPYHQFNRREILSILEGECRLFEQVLTESKPDFFFTNMVTRHPKYLIYKMCKVKGIKTATLELGRFGGRFLITRDVAKMDDPERYIESNLDLINTDQDLMNYLTKFKQRISGNVDINFETKKNKKILAGLNFLTRPLDENYTRNYLNYGKTKSKILFSGSRFILSLKRRKRRSFLDKNAVTNVKFDTPFIYFTLHSEPERELLIQAPFYTNQLTVITNIAKSIPVDYLLYVKEHPAMEEVGWRDIEYYKKILDLPNVKLIHPMVSSNDIVKKCNLAITLSGDVGLEASFFGKPSIVLSDSDYAVLPWVEYVKNIKDLPNSINKLLNKKIDSDYLKKFVTFYDRNSFQFDETGYLSMFNNLFYYPGYAMKLEITENKIKKLLETFSMEFDKLASHHIEKMKFYQSEKDENETM